VEVPFGEVTTGAGVGVAAGVPEGAGAADADDAGVPDGVGVGLAFACAAVSRLALRASAAVRFAPAAAGDTLALVVAVEVG
jgi:hypothetical protein